METIGRLLIVSNEVDKTKLNALSVEYLDNAEGSDEVSDNGEKTLDDDDWRRCRI